MGLFRRGDSDAQRAEVSEDEPDHQDAVIDLLNDFHEHDMTALAGLSPAQRADQLAARGGSATTSRRSGMRRRSAG